MARECPIRRGRKNEEAASIIRPRRVNTKPILLVRLVMRMVIGSVIVMPIPAAEPLRAAMVGLRQLWIAVVARPPLGVRLVVFLELYRKF
jgi:hypothetical protein